jgi:hypothetical protein
MACFLSLHANAAKKAGPKGSKLPNTSARLNKKPIPAKKIISGRKADNSRADH